MKTPPDTSQQNQTHKNQKPSKLKITLVITTILVLILIWHAAASPPKIPHISHDSALEIAKLKSSWAEGDLIILVRNAERCDQSTVFCVDPPDGTTVRGKETAIEVGAHYQKLGLSQTDIFTSPVTRTQQTANYMFNKKISDLEWLTNCKNTIFENSTNLKIKGRNLILVTHSDCMIDIEKNMSFSASDKPDYSSSLIISFGKNDKKPTPLGIINAKDWNSLL